VKEIFFFSTEGNFGKTDPKRASFLQSARDWCQTGFLDIEEVEVSTGTFESFVWRCNLFLYGIVVGVAFVLLSSSTA
jgi:hypothetical protein